MALSFVLLVGSGLMIRSFVALLFALILITVFAGVALVLAAVGLYSVLSTTVRQRTPEIGVRHSARRTAASFG